MQIHLLLPPGLQSALRQSRMGQARVSTLTHLPEETRLQLALPLCPPGSCEDRTHRVTCSDTGGTPRERGWHGCFRVGPDHSPPQPRSRGAQARALRDPGTHGAMEPQSPGQGAQGPRDPRSHGAQARAPRDPGTHGAAEPQSPGQGAQGPRDPRSRGAQGRALREPGTYGAVEPRAGLPGTQGPTETQSPGKGAQGTRDPRRCRA